MFNDIGFSEDGLAFTYDGNGNTIKDLNRNIASIKYNFLNLPEMITKTDQSSVRYGYSWSGQRLLKMIGTDTTVYIRTATEEIAGEYTNSPSALSYLNILSMDNSAAGQRRKEAGSWKSYFYVKDHLGNIRATIRVEGSTQTLVSATDYYPFGSVAREMNATTDENVKFRYQGKERDIETGYDYFEARTYDSQLGRFMQVDPMWEKYHNLTSFCSMANSPFLFRDDGGDTVTVTITGTQSNQTGSGWYLSGGKNTTDNVRVTLPLYNVQITNQTGSSSDFKFTRDATHESNIGKGAFLGTGKYFANINSKVTPDNLENTRAELAIIEIYDTPGRTGIQIHAIGQSKGCFMIENGEARNFLELLYKMLDEDGINGHGEVIIINIEKFTEDKSIREKAKKEYERRVEERKNRSAQQLENAKYFDDLGNDHFSRRTSGNYNTSYHPSMR